MSLTEGAKLGTYEITGQLGAGGMGEVYRASDSRLGRDVAIKTLPAAMASDRDRLARFEREARLLAGLDHPHIASVYGLDEHDGVLWLAMELVEGETLEEKLKPGALPVEDALRLSLQIAEALEAAHAKGVVHRDLKPANVMVTVEGVVKVLDFGLAKAFSQDPGESNVAQSPALSVAMTQQGLVLGTAGYMSPEQASGQPTDQRADVWAFGVVLYEMLTGLPLFSGESVPHILADVLRAEPDWGRLPKNLHPRVRELLERCLEKKPRERYAGIADARADIKAALADPRGVTPANADASTAAAGRTIWPLLAVTSVVAAALGGLIGWLILGQAESLPVTRFTLALADDQTFTEDENGVVDISPDGRTIVYAADNQLWLRDLDELRPRAVQGIDPSLRPTYPVFSPDGQSLVYYTDQNSGLWRISVIGGTPISLVRDLSDDPQGIYWHDDGRVLYVDDGNIMSVSVNGGFAETLIAGRDGEDLHGARILPGDEWVLFAATTASGASRWDEAAIVVQSLVTDDRIVLWQGGSDARYVPTGHLVYAQADALFALPFDLATVSVTGGATPVAAGVQRSRDLASDSATANYGIAGNGSLVYVTGSGSGNSRATLVFSDFGDTDEPLGIDTNASVLESRISPDGARIAMILRNDQGEYDVWTWSLQSQSLTRVSFESGDVTVPQWTPDGREIVYSVGDTLKIRRADGIGEVRELFTADGVGAFGWTPDGQIIVSVISGGHRDIGLVTMDGEYVPLLNSEFNESRVSLSPDGRLLAYQSDESGTSEIYVRPYPDIDAGRLIVSSGGAIDPLWSRDGGSLFYFSDSDVMTSRISVMPELARSIPEPVVAWMSRYLVTTGLPFNYDVAEDGRLLMRVNTGSIDETSARPEIVVVENWFQELNELVPVD